MDQILKLAGEAGLSEDQGKAATGGIMAMVKKALDSGDYKKILEQVPEVEGLVEQQERASTSESGGAAGMLGQAMSMFGNTGGGSGAAGSSGGAASIASLLAMMQKQGVGAREMNSFMPMLASFVKSQCGVDIGSMLGTGGATTGASTTPSATGGSGANDLQASLGGMMGGMFGAK